MGCQLSKNIYLFDYSTYHFIKLIAILPLYFYPRSFGRTGAVLALTESSALTDSATDGRCVVPMRWRWWGEQSPSGGKTVERLLEPSVDEHLGGGRDSAEECS